MGSWAIPAAASQGTPSRGPRTPPHPSQQRCSLPGWGAEERWPWGRRALPGHRLTHPCAHLSPNRCCHAEGGRWRQLRAGHSSFLGRGQGEEDGGSGPPLSQGAVQGGRGPGQQGRVPGARAGFTRSGCDSDPSAQVQGRGREGSHCSPWGPQRQRSRVKPVCSELQSSFLLRSHAAHSPSSQDCSTCVPSRSTWRPPASGGLPVGEGGHRAGPLQ